MDYNLTSAGVNAGGKILGGVANWFGADSAEKAKKRGIRMAQGDINEGYGNAMDLNQPIYDTALGDYKNLSQSYGRGEYDMPESKAYQGGQFNWNPGQVFEDPEYKANLQAGTDAISQSAASKGNLFSGETGQDLRKYGQDLFAQRSDELYGRGRHAFENDRDFGFDANNTAWNQNFARTGRDFQQGAELAGYLPGAANTLTDLNTDKAQQLANLDLGYGQAGAEGARGQSDALSGMLGGVGEDAGGYLSLMGQNNRADQQWQDMMNLYGRRPQPNSYQSYPTGRMG